MKKKAKKVKKDVKLVPWLGYETRYDGESEYGCPVMVWLPDDCGNHNMEAWVIFMVGMGYATGRGDAHDMYAIESTVNLGDGRSVEFDLKGRLTLEEYAILNKCCIWDDGRAGRSILDIKRTDMEQRVFNAKAEAIKGCREVINALLASDRDLEGI